MKQKSYNEGIRVALREAAKAVTDNYQKCVTFRECEILMLEDKLKLKSRNRLSGSDRFMETQKEGRFIIPELPSRFNPGDKIGLQMLINLLYDAHDAEVVSVSFTESKVKYNLAVPRIHEGKKIGYFRLANVDSAYIEETTSEVEPVANEVRYNSQVAQMARWNDPNHKIDGGTQFFTDSEYPTQEHNTDGKPMGYSVSVLVDLNGNKKDYAIGWYDFDEKSWKFNQEDKSQLDAGFMLWAYLPK